MGRQLAGSETGAPSAGRPYRDDGHHEHAKLFEKIAKQIDPVLAARWTRREVLRLLNDKKKELRETAFDAAALTELFGLLHEKKITDRI